MKKVITKEFKKVRVYTETKAGKQYPGGKVNVSVLMDSSNGEEWLTSLMSSADVPTEGKTYQCEVYKDDYGWKFVLPTTRDILGQLQARVALLEAKMSIDANAKKFEQPEQFSSSETKATNTVQESANTGSRMLEQGDPGFINVDDIPF